MPDTPFNIFISYNHSDSAFVERLAADLRQQGFDPWVDRERLVGGQRWRRALQSAVQRAQVLLIVLSPDAVASDYVQIEYGYVLDLGKAVIPIYYRECDIPMELRGIQWIDFRRTYEQGMQDLVQALQRQQQGFTSTYPPRQQPPPPYPPQPTPYPPQQPPPRSYPPQQPPYAAQQAPPPPYPPQPTPYPPQQAAPPPYTPQQQVHQPYPYAVSQPAEPGRGLAVAGLVLGILSLIFWLIPLLGYPVTIVGIILAAMGRRSISRRSMATWGLVLSIIGLVATIINSALGAYIASHP